MGYTLIKINTHMRTHTETHKDTQWALSLSIFHPCCVTGRASAADLWHVLCHTEMLFNEEGCDRASDQMAMCMTNEVWHQQKSNLGECLFAVASYYNRYCIHKISFSTVLGIQSYWLGCFCRCQQYKKKPRLHPVLQGQQLPQKSVWIPWHLALLPVH